MTAAPGPRRGVRLVHDPVRARDALLYPEGTLLLDGAAADVVRACDGSRDVTAIAAVLGAHYDGVHVEDIETLLADLVARRLFTMDGAGRGLTQQECAGSRADTAPLPIGMLAELTYRCPLHCGYCSNPLQIAPHAEELTTVEWLDVLDQARRLGVLQVHLSGGEPLLRPDLVALVARARRLGMYTNLITSGIPLSAARLAPLVDAGLDHVQLSIQDADATGADLVAGIRAHDRKLAAAALVRDAGLPLTVNVVLHAGNVARIPAIAALAVRLGADRLELAHTQYYGWGLRNRAALLPSAAQVAAAGAAATEAHHRFGTAVEIVYVEPDYHTGRPKPCMNGWGSRQLVVTPTGTVLPCLAADQLPGFTAGSVRDRSLHHIWHASESFNRFRGTTWMPEPCQSCALRDIDFGGCRCQAFQLTGDPAATDPACELSAHHDELAAVASAAGADPRPPMIPRRYR
jgi:pyrroloquinoline quinone biosynthesis protein E